MPKQTDQTCLHSKNCWKGGGSYVAYKEIVRIKYDEGGKE